MAIRKFISWNVNGIRACLGKDFYESFASLDADIFCLQETKMQEGQAELVLDGCGTIVKEYDEDGIVEAIKSYINAEKKQCFQIGAHHYEKEQCYKKYLEVYETLKG